MAKSLAVLRTNLGLWLNRPPLDVPLAALQDGNNFRIYNGELTNEALGWASTGLPQLNGQVMLIERFRTRTIGDKTIFATLKDLYHYNGTTVTYITPRYSTGTVAASAANPAVVTGTGTLWNSGDPKNAKAGDQIHFGNAAQTSLTARWYTIASVDSDTQLTLTEQIDGGGGVGAGTAYTIRKLFTGAVTDQWEAEPFISGPSNTDWLYLTNGVNPVTRWDGAATAAVYSGVYASGLTAVKHLSVFQNMMVYGNVVEAGASKTATIVNSVPGDPEDIVGGLSEEFKVHDDAGPIQRMLPIGDSLIIYSSRTVVAAQFVGDPLIFTFRKAVSDTGPVNPKLVLDFGDYHQFIGQDVMYRFDGAALQRHGVQVWQTVLRNLDPSRIHQGVSLINEEFAEAYWAIPLVSDPTTQPASAFPEHYLEEPTDQQPVFSKRDFPFTAAGLFTQATTITWDNFVGSWDASSAKWDDIALVANFPKIFAGDKDGFIWELNNSQSQNGVAMNSFVKFGRRPTTDGVQKALIWRVYPFAQDANGTGQTLDVYVHFADAAHANAVQTGPYPFDLTIPEDGHFVTIRRRGRFFETEFRMISTTGAWQIEGYDYEPRGGGTR